MLKSKKNYSTIQLPVKTGTGLANVMIEGIHFWIDECKIFLKYIQLGIFKSKIADLTDTGIEMIKFILHFTLIFRRRET